MGRQENTKELFVIEALKLFGERGYDSVRISDIAEAVGCTAPALYKHYKNKQELFAVILEESKKNFDQVMEKMQIDYKDRLEEREKIISMTEKDFVDRIISIFNHAISNPMASAFRHFMNIEQYHIKELAEIYSSRYVFSQYEQNEALFLILMEAGRMEKGDAYILAVEFVSPVIVMIDLCDRDPSREKYAREVLESHVKNFYRRNIKS
ncbi:MAG: TetR/AcrR family transcriptional regulator [Treponema sp.]|nr:TetR/AcrR family transcriptional regulator [Treponema sp.]